MLEAILKFVTPGGSLTLPSRFSWRVVTSWITCGWVLGVIGALISIFQPSSGVEVSNIILVVVVGLPCALCFYGFLGLAVDLARGSKLFYPGWYWYAYPLITAFWIAILIILFFLALMGIKFPEQHSREKIDLQKFRKEIQKSKLEEIIDGYRQELEQLSQLEQKGKLKPEQAKIIRKIRNFDRSKYDHLIEDLFEDEESEEFSILLLITMGMEAE